MENQKTGLIDVEQSVRNRYSQASQQVEVELCCPVDYDPKFLAVLPEEILQRDYGCGDPSQYVNSGEIVLDLGSGGGKICYIASQIVGPTGHVYGVDVNDDMLALANKYRSDLATKIGWDNVSFYKSKIQDLKLDLTKFESYLKEKSVSNFTQWQAADQHAAELRETDPVIKSESIDVVLSNCVLNLVCEEDRRQMFAELHRVLKDGGRAVISDIVSDEVVPEEMKNDPKLWSGCISGAFVEDQFLEAFADAGFYGIEIMKRQDEPWVVVNGIEFRSMTVRAYKGKEGACLDHNHAVVYKGPWKSVTDDDGHEIQRGVRTAVCKKNMEIYAKSPYAGQFEIILPSEPVTEPTPFNCRAGSIRQPSESKGSSQKPTSSLNVLPSDQKSSGCCSSPAGSNDSGCC